MNKYESGYTLIEVIIALAVFAILSTLTASVMMQSFNTKKHLAIQTERMQQIQVAIPVIRRDIAQAINRAVRGNELRLFPPFIGESNYTEFTRGGFVNPNSTLKSSSLKRIAYLCQGDHLIRRSWPVVDSPARKEYRDQIFLKNITHCSFSYISQSQEILSVWRPYALSQRQKNASLPAGIQLSLTFKVLGKMDFLFTIPEGMYA